MKTLLALLFLTFSLSADPNYHTLFEQFPEVMGRLGSWKRGEIEIATNPAEIKKIENHCYHKLLRKGFSTEEAKRYSRVGIVAEDQYWIWVRDAVYFPGGIMGTYERLLRKTGLIGPSGVVIFAVRDKKVVVNVNFRHTTRCWELELPRGGQRENETLEQAAKRELKEETGCIVKKFTFLGTVASGTGVIGGTRPVYFGTVTKKVARHLDESEAIATSLEISIEDLKEAFSKGYIILDVRGRKTKVFCRDPFLSYAILQAMWQKLI